MVDENSINRKTIEQNGHKNGHIASPNGNGNGNGNGKNGSIGAAKPLRVGQAVGKPSISRSKIKAAVRAVKKEMEIA